MSYIKNFCTLITEILNVCQTRISIYRNLTVVKSLSRVCMLKYNRDISRPAVGLILIPRLSWIKRKACMSLFAQRPKIMIKKFNSPQWKALEPLSPHARVYITAPDRCFLMSLDNTKILKHIIATDTDAVARYVKFPSLYGSSLAKDVHVLLK